MQQIQLNLIKKINNKKTNFETNRISFKKSYDNDYISVKQSNVESLKVPLCLGMLAGHCTFMDKSKEQLKENLKSLKNKTMGNGFNALATIGAVIIVCGFVKTITDYYNNKKQTILKFKKEKNETNEKTIKKNLTINTVIQTATVFITNFLFGCFNLKNNRKTAFERSSGFAIGSALL